MSELRSSRNPPSRLSSCEGLTELLRTPQYLVSTDVKCSFVLVRRTPTPFDQMTDLDDTFARMNAAITNVPRASFGLLIDTRRGPMRNDTAFEAAFAKHRPTIEQGFARVAILALTATGRLQIARHAKDDGLEVFVVDDPPQAFKYLGVADHEFALHEDGGP